MPCVWRLRIHPERVSIMKYSTLAAIAALSASLGVFASNADAQETCAGTGPTPPTGTFSLACGDRAVADGFGATAVGSLSDSVGTYSSAYGHTAQAMGGASTAIGAGSYAEDAGTGLGAASRATGARSVAIGVSSIADEDDTVSFGSSEAKRRLTNLSNGIALTDAATVGQLEVRASAITASANSHADAGDAATLASARTYSDASAAQALSAAQSYAAAGDAATLTAARTYADNGDLQTLTAAKAYTDSQLASLGGGSREMREYADAGTAAAIAAASIPQAFSPGGSMIGAGLGHWRGESALSLGASHMLASGRVVLRGSATFANRGGSGGGMGVGIAF